MTDTSKTPFLLKILQQICSIRACCIRGKIYKVYTLLGLKIRIRDKFAEYDELLKNTYPYLLQDSKIALTILESSFCKNFHFFYSNQKLSSPKDLFVLFRYDFISIFQDYGVNIGDYVQTKAVSNALYSIFPNAKTTFCDRDSLSVYNGEPAFAIMQGWFAHDYYFLPNNRIKPIWVGTHITPKMKHFVAQFVNYNPDYFNNTTIGCRDIDTVEFFNQLGIKSYFSRCLTLTLPKRQPTNRQNKVFIVNVPEKYHQYIPQNLLEHAEFVNQRNIDSNIEYRHYFETGDKYLKEADKLLQKYADEAKLIITTALHCASPCTALGIPVVLIDMENKNTRFGAVNNIIKIYSLDDLKNQRVDFQPVAPDIEDLKAHMLKNLKLSIQQEQGLPVNQKELDEVRQYISDYSCLNH